MRIKVIIATTVLIIFLLAVYFLSRDVTLNAAALENTRAVCQQCHGAVPGYQSADMVIDKHANFECSFCHGSSYNLTATDSIHNGLKWAGAGALGIVLAGVIANLVIINRKGG